MHENSDSCVDFGLVLDWLEYWADFQRCPFRVVRSVQLNTRVTVREAHEKIKSITRYPRTRLIVAFIVHLMHLERPRDGQDHIGAE